MDNIFNKNYNHQVDPQAVKALHHAIEQDIKANGGANAFIHNIIALCSINFILAKAIYDLKSNTKFDVFAGKGNLDINIINTHTKTPIYSGSPAEHTINMLDKFKRDYALYPSLFFYGLGNGNFYKALLENKNHKKIVVFEPEIEILFIAFCLNDFSKEMRENRFIPFCVGFLNDAYLHIICNQKEIKYNAKNYDFHIYNDYYDQTYKQNANSINKRLLNILLLNIKAAGNSPEDTLIGMKHVVENMPKFYANYSLKDILNLNTNHNQTAIIVSTGPSLTKQLELLRSVAPYAILIAADASYPILKLNNIRPDFVTTMERIELSGAFFDSEVSEFDNGITFIASSLIHPNTIKLLKGRDVAFAHKPLKFEEALGEDPKNYMCKGPSTAHFAFDLAIELGCKQIIFIGQDLAMADDGTTHARGMVFGETSPTIASKEYESNITTTLGYGGKTQVKSIKIWDMFREYFEAMIDAISSYTDVKVYNATEGGSRIRGTIERPFGELVSEIINSKVKKNLLKPEPISPDISHAKLQSQKQIIENFIKIGKDKQDLIKELFKKISKLVEPANADLANGKEPRYAKFYELKDRIDRLKANLDSDKSFNDVYMSAAYNFCLHQELDFATLMVRPEKDKSDRDKKIFEYVKQHGYYFFSLAGLIENTIDTLQTALDGWEI
ncbi:motility associated factor glycosyltransferase family protein [Campylobacter lanienae]|uniref:motility associated factor glycosyltransferase family protein n=1 Tax=Campylobacter lanienae TaxID=75658 RepID=UPI000BB43A0D|nr:6-hydroxymethylpterin diphosphokinase MptE-like protein [Campylobacter lanienae]